MTAAALGMAAGHPQQLGIRPGISALLDAIHQLMRAETTQQDRPSGANGSTSAGSGLAAPPQLPDDVDHGEPGAVWAVVSRAQAGDPDAFAELYDMYVDTVFRYVHFRAGTRTQAEDLTSETFVRALRRITSVSWQGRDFGAWLITIARNLIADHYKSARYRLEISTADMVDADRAEDGPEDAVLDAMSSATLIDAVKELNAEQQECIVLRFLQGFSVSETAQAMGKNEGAVKALQYRAVRTLGRLLPDGFVR
ncbi:MAG: sigma-70 family RNA polymerase sigma factor [Mycobacteriales bacterium]